MIMANGRYYEDIEADGHKKDGRDYVESQDDKWMKWQSNSSHNFMAGRQMPQNEDRVWYNVSFFRISHNFLRGWQIAQNDGRTDRQTVQLTLSLVLTIVSDWVEIVSLN